MTILETLTERQKIALEEAQENLTIDMLESLEYGEEIQMNELITLYHYSEEDIIVLNLTEEWEEVLQVMITEKGGILFEEL